MIALCLLLTLALTLIGCASPLKKLDAEIPDGNWKKARVAGTFEMVNGQLEASGKKKDGRWISGHVKGEYNGFWVKRFEVELEVEEEKNPDAAQR